MWNLREKIVKLRRRSAGPPERKASLRARGDLLGLWQSLGRQALKLHQLVIHHFESLGAYADLSPEWVVQGSQQVN
jgi:hypothetical protein